MYKKFSKFHSNPLISFRHKNSQKRFIFEELCLSGIFVYKNCAKSLKKIFSSILRIYLLSPTSFISIFILTASKKNS